MVTSCSRIPLIGKKQEESKLFKDLLSYTNSREKTRIIYLTTKNGEFLNQYLGKIPQDSLFEFTLEGLLANLDMEDIVEKRKVITRLFEEIGYSNDGILKSYPLKSYQMLLKRVVTFNREHPLRNLYKATVITRADGMITPSIQEIPKSKTPQLYSLSTARLEYDELLNRRLREVLSQFGISTGVIDRLIDGNVAKGVTDFSVSLKTIEGLNKLIRLAEGIEGEKALPEEFSHFAIEALGDTSTHLNRLLELLRANPNLVREALGEEFAQYEEYYNSNPEVLVKEAAGKLLANSLLKVNKPSFQDPYVETKTKNWLERFKDFIVRMLKPLVQKINKIQEEAANQFNMDNSFSVELANQILKGNLSQNMSLDNIHTSQKYYQASTKVKAYSEILNKIKATEYKRFKLSSTSSLNIGATEGYQRLSERFKEAEERHEEKQVIYDFLKGALLNLAKLEVELSKYSPSKIKAMGLLDVDDLNKHAFTLRETKNFLESYKQLAAEIDKSLLENELYTNNDTDVHLQDALDEVNALVSRLNQKYTVYSTPIATSFLRSFLGTDSGLDINELLKIMEGDISLFNAWLDSAGNSPDVVIQLFHKAIAKAEDDSRALSIKFIDDLQAEQLILEQSGIKNTDWMFERDDDNNITSNFLSPVNQTKYSNAKDKFFKELKEKYKNRTTKEEYQNYKEEIAQWYKNNTTMIGNVQAPRLDKYESNQLKKLNSAQKRYYDFIIKSKKEIDALLPPQYISLYAAPQKRRTTLERVLGKEGIKSKSSLILDKFKDLYREREDDTEFGNIDIEVTKDFEGKEVYSLPLFYTKRLDNINEMSTDVSSIMASYVNMAYNYSEKSKVVHVMELSRSVVENRQIIDIRGGKKLVDKSYSALENSIKYVFKNGAESNAKVMLDSLFERQLYGRYQKRGSTHGKNQFSTVKLSGTLQKAASISSLGFNATSGAANLIQIALTMNIEAASGEFFNIKDLAAADGVYFIAVPQIAAQSRDRVKTNKVYLFEKLFNLTQSYHEKIENVKIDKNSLLSKLFSTKTLMVFNALGEHWASTRTGLAFAQNIKVLDNNKREVTLWDALEVDETKHDSKTVSARLVFKKGYTKLDGSALTQDYINKLGRQMNEINKNMHGIYNALDSIKAKGYIAGRLVTMYRNWIIPNLKKRFQKNYYNATLEQSMEGYYQTFGKFVKVMGHSLLRMRMSQLSESWDSMSRHQKANMRRAIIDLSQILAMYLALTLISFPKDKNRPWALKMTEYLLHRGFMDMGALTPGPTMISEGFKLLESPSAAIKTLEQTIGLFKLFSSDTWTVDLKSGPYKGHTLAYKLGIELPFFPGKSIYRTLDPDQLLSFYTNK